MVRKTTEEQLKEAKQEQGLYCPNCKEAMPVVDSGYPAMIPFVPLFAYQFLWGFFGVDPRIYLCTRCGHEFDPLTKGRR